MTVKFLGRRCNHFWMVGGFTQIEKNARHGYGPEPAYLAASFLFCSKCLRTMDSTFGPRIEEAPAAPFNPLDHEGMK